MSGVAAIHPTYRPDIDGLRAIAVLSVVGFHAFPEVFRAGFIGVDIFFVISGYLISAILLGSLERGCFSIGDFYVRRIRRIFPALIMVLAATLAAGWGILLAAEYESLSRHVMGGAAFFSNFLLWGESGYFDSAAEYKPLLHLWSLAIEEQFYLVWPWFLALTWRWRRHWFAIAGAVAGASLVAGYGLLTGDAAAGFYLPVARFWELMAGGLLAFQALCPRRGTSSRRQLVLSVGGLCVLLASFLLIDRERQFPGFWALLPVGGAMLLIAAGPAGPVNRHLLSHPLLVGIGLISYPLYLWHWPILSFLRILLGKSPSPGLTVMGVALSGWLAWMTYKVIECRIRPTRSLRVPVALVLLLAGLALIAWGIVRQGGAPQRPGADELQHLSEKSLIEGSRVSDGSCQSLLGLGPVADEVCLASHRQPTVLMVGDSHAMALYSAIFADRFEQPAALLAAHSCPLYPTLDYSPDHSRTWGRHCDRVADQVLALLSRIPSVETVVIANIARKNAGSGWPSLFGSAGRSLSHGEAFIAGHAGMIEGLLQAGKRVVFIIDVPHLRRDPVHCVQRLPFLAPPDCRVERAQHDKQRKDYLAMVATLQARFPQLAVFDPRTSFCGAAYCELKLDGQYLYNDRDHLSIAGSHRLLSALRAGGYWRENKVSE